MQEDLEFPIVSVLADFTQGPPNSVGAGAGALDTGDGRGIETMSIGRGRPYELGTVQAGTCSITVDDPAETLNPANPASPFQSGGRQLALYRAVGTRAWWPRTGNLLDERTYEEVGFHPGFEVAGGTNGWSSPGGVIANVTDSPQQGARCLRLTLDGPTAVATPLGGAGYLHIAGRVHTYSVWVRRSATSTGVSITLSVGAVTSAPTTSTAWTRLAVTYLADTVREVPTLTVTGGASGDGTQVIFIDAEQLELGDTATAWTATGPVRYPIFTGYVERYPQEWVDNGWRGRRPLEAVDALAPMSRTIISGSYEREIAADEPSLYLPLNDPSGPGHAEGPLAGTTRLTEFLGTKGGSISWGGATMPDGAPAVVLSQQLQDPGDTPLAEQVTEIDTRAPVGPSPARFLLDTRGATIEFWLRLDASVTKIAFQAIASGNFQRLHAGAGDTIAQLSFYNDASHALSLSTPSGEDVLWGVAPPDHGNLLADGQWHYLAMVAYPSSTDATKYSLWGRADTVTRGLQSGRAHRQAGINSVHIDARTQYGDPLSKLAIGRIAFYNKILPDSRLQAHYLQGIGNAGETASARATRLLTAYWGGPFIVRPGSGLTLASDHSYRGSGVLAALEDITATDEGLLFVDGQGRPVVESRLTRHEQTGPAVTFGEDSASGELPYAQLAFDYDPQYVYSQISLTRPGRSDPLVLVDEQVEALVGQRVYSRQLAVTSDFELEQAALFYQRRYGQARLRIKSLQLDPASNPALWPAVLGLELSQRVRVRRRTSAGVVLSGEYYVESIKHDADVTAPSWRTTLELSPVFVPSAWVLGDPQRGVLGQTTTPVY